MLQIRRQVGLLVKDEVERIWQETVVTQLNQNVISNFTLKDCVIFRTSQLLSRRRNKTDISLIIVCEVTVRPHCSVFLPVYRSVCLLQRNSNTVKAIVKTKYCLHIFRANEGIRRITSRIKQSPYNELNDYEQCLTSNNIKTRGNCEVYIHACRPRQMGELGFRHNLFTSFTCTEQQVNLAQNSVLWRRQNRLPLSEIKTMCSIC